MNSRVLYDITVGLKLVHRSLPDSWKKTYDVCREKTDLNDKSNNVRYSALNDVTLIAYA